jgi:toxin YoeB
LKKKIPKSPDNQPKRSRETVMDSQFTEDLRFWIEIDRKLALRIMDLVKETLRDPFSGIGKPERLKYFKDNTWSRRINDEHRLVYVVENDRIRFKTARHHYKE